MCKIIKNTILDDVLNMHNDGCSNREIADQFGISDVKVRKLLITAGIVPDSDTCSSVTAMYRKGYSAKEIAAICNIGFSTASSYLPYSKCVYGLENVSRTVLQKREMRRRK